MNKEKAIALAAKLLSLSTEQSAEYCHEIVEEEAFYFSVPIKGGDSLIVSPSGEVLYANSSVGYDLHLAEYQKGTRTPLKAFGF